MGQDTLDMAALDGYVGAIKVLTLHNLFVSKGTHRPQLIDHFRERPRSDSAEEFSYHLWHIAAGQHDEAEYPRFDFSPTFLDFSWDTVPNEIKKVSALVVLATRVQIEFFFCGQRNIHYSMILLKPCPKLSKLFRAVREIPSTLRYPPHTFTCLTNIYI
jgi:hypothetical protein